jgi:hypothetical protein
MAGEILKISLLIKHLIRCRLQKSNGKEGRHRKPATPQGKRFHA